jgi:hypothetical protein
MTQFRDCLAIVPRLRKPGISVEQELAKLQEQAKTFPQVYRELVAVRYYLHSALRDCQEHWRGCHNGITNYVTLLREIERWRYEFKEHVCLVTFNYDTMLEEAAQQVLGFTIRDLNSYVSHDDYTLIKLHGSIDWGREVDGIESLLGYNPARVIKDAADLQISNRYRLVREFPMLKVDNVLVFPALTIPIEKKDEFECPDEHVKALAQHLPKVTKIITVGWRATESKFLNMLSNRLTGLTGAPHLMVTSGSKDGCQETLQNLGGARSTFYPVENGFSGLILDNCDLLDHFLRAAHS